MTDRARVSRSRRRTSRGGRVAGALLLALASGAGCGREFFREWANQDVSEAVFEKSRDPRWRMDLFSVDPPALSRFADPYDPDRPPAPPDDHATEALSPVPQWPDHRLLVPVEGTGYLDMLEAWSRDRPADDDRRPPVAAAPALGDPSAAPGPFDPAGATPDEAPPSTPSPFGPAPNPGTDAAPTTPSTDMRGTPAIPAPNLPQASARRADPGLRRAAFQETEIPQPTPPAGAPAGTPPGLPALGDPAAPDIPLDPNPINPDLSQPVRARPDLTPEEADAAEAATAEMAGVLVPGAIDLDEAEAAGLPAGSRPYIINPEQSLRLALINSRAYQFRLENVYLASLAVTLQRFAFQPQFIAGLNPSTTGTSAGSVPGSSATSFLYRTQEAPGGQISTLSLGSVAGFGKLFINGTRLLTSFANTTVFNFVGSNPRQPSVQSFLPLSIVQPFLRGGGRAVTLELLTQAERALVYELRSFARFRQEFFVNILGATTPVTNAGLNDPAIGYLQVVQLLQQVENARFNVASFERLLEVFSELALGESSGLTQLQVDQIDQQLQSSRQQLAQATINFQNNLDQYKMQLGLPPETPLVLDRRILDGFRNTFVEILEWSADPKRELEALTRFVAQLPKLQEIVIDGREVLEIAGIDAERDPIRAKDPNRMAKPQPDKQEDLLLAAERIMLENRLDLMNARAQLYDAWRQIKFTANGLLGTFNVALTNQYLTPADTTNPFAFVDQSKQFSLVFNADLPLVRVAERNEFREALINYQRQRRALMNAEDSLKFQIRQEVRDLQLSARIYEIQIRSFVLNLRRKDQSQEQLIAPPQGATGGNAANAATQTNNLISAQSSVLNSQNALVSTWVDYQTARLILFRDLGIMPYDEWEAYHELFPATTNESRGSGASPAGGGTGLGLDPGPGGAGTIEAPAVNP